jgi:SCY1-like protein 1
VDTIAALFRVNDRGIRGSLLQKMPYLAQVLDASALNNLVFEPMCSGYSDSSPALRELTLKATLGLVPHLTQPNLEKLSRYLVRLQADPEASIRTNTVIFFSKLAPHLTESTRHKQLLPAFVRALKDPFPPCRLSALRSVLQAKEFFGPAGIASSVLPAVAPQLLDPAADVRREAFLVVDDLLFFLRQESERMPDSGATGDGGQPGGAAAGARPAPSPSSGPAPTPLPPAAAPAPASGGYLSGLSSWVTSAAAAAPPPPPAASASAAAPAPAVAPPPPRVNAMQVASAHLSSLALQDSGGGSWGGSHGDGWGDDFDDDDDDGFGGDGSGRSRGSAGGAAGRAAAPPPPAGGSLFGGPAVSEDELFGAMTPASSAASSRRPGAGPGARLAVPAKPSSSSPTSSKPKVTRLDVGDDYPSGDGWDDF